MVKCIVDLLCDIVLAAGVFKCDQKSIVLKDEKCTAHKRVLCPMLLTYCHGKRKGKKETFFLFDTYLVSEFEAGIVPNAQR